MTHNPKHLEGESPREPYSEPISHKERKHPIHMPFIERHNRPVILFMTLTIKPRGPFLANNRTLTAFRTAASIADAWSIGYYLIMPDHIHFFCRPATAPRIRLKRWVLYIKREITIQLHSPRKWRWQSDYWDTQIRGQDHYHAKWDYIRFNPVRQELADDPQTWPWQGRINDLDW